MIFKITNQDNDKYLICCTFNKLIDIIKQFNMHHVFMLNSNDGDTFNRTLFYKFQWSITTIDSEIIFSGSLM